MSVPGQSSTLPAAVAGPARQHLASLSDAWAMVPDLPPLADADWFAEAARVFACSDYAARQCCTDPALLAGLVADGSLWRGQATGALRAELDEQLATAAGEDALLPLMRRFRHRHMVRITWRDLCGHADLPETLGDLSELACTCIDAVLEKLYAWHCQRWGTPVDASGEAQRLVILGLGKLGGAELNFSSDIDLIAAFDSGGETDAAVPRANIEFFTRLTQRLIHVLNTPTANGFVFRIDMRLRPFGDSGPLVVSRDALEHYYLTQGREWERYAMLKARVVAGDQQAGDSLVETLRPFVFRRYLDYGAFESLREMKANIKREVARRGLRDNIKLGRGGIREIEFIGQAFQLLRGGRQPELQVRGILTALARISDAGYLPANVTTVLASAYTFLRRLENRLQMLADEQTHELPRDPLVRARIAFAMDYPDWVSLEQDLLSHTEVVAAQFEDVFHTDEQDTVAARRDPLRDLWSDSVDETAAIDLLGELGYYRPSEVVQMLAQLRGGRLYHSLTTTAGQRLDSLMPAVLRACARQSNDTETLRRLFELLRHIASRSVYLSLLLEHPQALEQLVTLFAASNWIADYVCQHPILLDELLDPRTLYALPDAAAMHRELEGMLARTDALDVEAQLDQMRQFKHVNMLRIAAVDIGGEAAIEQVSAHLSELAQTVLAQVYRLVWQQMVERHGNPGCRVDGQPRQPQVAIIAYGKLGGRELGYGSDLDLVFLHDSDGEAQHTDGERSIDNTTFFTRFAQKLIHFLSTRTAAGILYETDTRLRPNGSAGLLVSPFAAFEAYQSTDAWTWEHQALVRARPVVAPGELGQRFMAVRARILGAVRDQRQLRTDIVEMRERMLADRPGADTRDLKHVSGGITDIEFVVQYLVLANAAGNPCLLDYFDNVRLLQVLSEAGALAPRDAELLVNAYHSYRACAHEQALAERGSAHADEANEVLCAKVAELWRNVMINDDPGDQQ